MAGIVLLINDKHCKKKKEIVVLKEKAPPLNIPKNAFTNASNQVRVVFFSLVLKAKKCLGL